MRGAAVVACALMVLLGLWLLALDTGRTFWALQYQQQSCEMTYMYPNFEKIDLEPQNPAAPPKESSKPKQQQRYRLWRYIDGVNSPGCDDTITTPALFIPGNAGGHNQVRCMASETARVWAAQQAAFAGVPMQRVYIEWYSIDTGEEWAAFSGDLLERQTEYALKALRYLTNHYKLHSAQSNTRHSAYQHPGVLLVGHSMGGVVAKAVQLRAASDDTLGPNSVAAVIALASPLLRPPLSAHPSLQRFYRSLSLSQSDSQLHTQDLSYTPLVSVSSGFNDTQIAHALTSPYGVHPRSLSLHITAPAIPGVWLSPHHSVIVWCNQLLKPFTRFLTDAAWRMHCGPNITAYTPTNTTKEPANPSSAQTTIQASQMSTAGLTFGQHGGGGGGENGTGRAQWGGKRMMEARLRHAGEILSIARQYLLPKDVYPPPGFAALHGGAGQAAEPVVAGSERAAHAAATEQLAHAAPAHATRAAGVSAHTSVLQGTGAETYECTGPNLVWYQQYQQAKRVGEGEPASGSGGGAPDHTLNLRGTKIANKLARLEGRGQLYTWALDPSTPSWFYLRVSAAPPCQAFRVWAVAGGPTSATDPTPSSHDDNGDMNNPTDVIAPALRSIAREVSVEVTRMATWLPLAHKRGRRHVRNWSLSDEIMYGVNYNETASWALALSAAQLAGATSILLWLGTPTNATAFTVTGQLLPSPPSPSPPSTLQVAQATNNPPQIQLGWRTFLAPVALPQNSPTTVVANIHLPKDAWVGYVTRYLVPLVPAPMRPTVLAMVQDLAAACSSVLQAAGAMRYVSLRVDRQAPPRTPRAPRRRPSARMDTVVVVPCAAAGRSVGEECGDATYVPVANQTVYGLQACWGSGQNADACRVTVLADTLCGAYSLRLVWSVGAHLPSLVLANLNTLLLLLQGIILAIAAYGLDCVSASQDTDPSRLQRTSSVQSDQQQAVQPHIHDTPTKPGRQSPPGSLPHPPATPPRPSDTTHWLTDTVRYCTQSAFLMVAGLVALVTAWLSESVSDTHQGPSHRRTENGSPRSVRVSDSGRPWSPSRPQFATPPPPECAPGVLRSVAAIVAVIAGAALPWLAWHPPVAARVGPVAVSLGVWVCADAGCSAENRAKPVDLALLFILACTVLALIAGVIWAPWAAITRLIGNRSATKAHPPTPPTSPGADSRGTANAGKPVHHAKRGRRSAEGRISACVIVIVLGAGLDAGLGCILTWANLMGLGRRKGARGVLDTATVALLALQCVALGPSCWAVLSGGGQAPLLSRAVDSVLVILPCVLMVWRSFGARPLAVTPAYAMLLFACAFALSCAVLGLSGAFLWAQFLSITFFAVV